MKNDLPFTKENLNTPSPHLNEEKVVNDPATITRQKTKKPSMYRVIMLNDDYTPMDFVIYVLEMIFDKPTEEAISIMLSIHNNGIGMCGIFTYEIAEEKISQVMNLAQQNQHPLQCTLEKE